MPRDLELKDDAISAEFSRGLWAVYYFQLGNRYTCHGLVVLNSVRSAPCQRPQHHLLRGSCAPTSSPTVEAAPYAAHIPKSVTMSFLFGGRPQLSSAEKIAAAETEIEMVSDMFNRLLPRFKIIILSEAH